MEEKLKELLGSVRFWVVTIAAAIAILAVFGIIPDEVQKILIAWLGTVAGIGTLDSVSKKLSGN